MEKQRRELGARVRQARLDRGWSKEEAARHAGISSITWKRVEDGLGVQDHKRFTVLRTLGLDDQGQAAEPVAAVDLVAEVMASNLPESVRAEIIEAIRRDGDQGRRPMREAL